ncbi:TRAP transporter large permease [Gordoniibacillus kamchatkensis]|uniref:TRAP transporter large permease n=1 Tax=Gordoniibacillus kamchatkensis TaxID=1590651 RepID=UPI000AFE2B9D|nr:TRAP transporter large permease [Paenibacillus sp. VKM B-2647]
MQSLSSKLFNGLQNFGFVAIPMFVLLGEIMNRGGITKRLIQFATVLVGHLRGGLAYVNVIANMFLAAIVGSSNVQTAIMGKVIVPEMEKRGYDKEFSTALTASSSIMGPLIPPSMPFIIYGVTSGASIGSLFFAGIIPGLLFALGFGIIIYAVFRKTESDRMRRSTVKEMAQSLLGVLPALFIPVLIMVGITTGAFTATESAAVAVFAAILIGAFVYRELKLRDVPGILLRTIITTSSVSFLLATTNIFGWVLHLEGIPHKIADIFLSLAGSKFMFLILLNVLLIVIGTFLEGVAGIIFLTPILLPIAAQYGVDPIHLGAIMVINLTIGLMHPPFGTVLYIASATTGVSVERLTVKLIPFLLVMFGILLLVTYLPWTTSFLPGLFAPK